MSDHRPSKTICQRAAATDPFRLSNSASSVVTQVMVLGNTVLASDGAKKVIQFMETAATGKWNGVVENNMATVTNKPNNV